MKPAPSLPGQRNDIHAVMASGFGWLQSSRFSLLTIRNVLLARAWLVSLEQSGLVKSVGCVTEQRSLGIKPCELASIAFSFTGLRMLELVESTQFPFPTAFRSGMGSDLRKELLRDGERDKWQWSDHDTEPRQAPSRSVHILLAHWWQTATASTLPVPDAAAFSVREIHGCPSFFRDDTLYEAFGFRDGISQPTIYGVKDLSDEGEEVALSPQEMKTRRDNVVAAGEFILGYRNEYDELSCCADVQGWVATGADAHPGARFALNGSYLAVRQIDQDLEGFAKLHAQGAAGCPSHVSLAEKMMGRRQDGAPLGACPVRPLVVPTENGACSDAPPANPPLLTDSQANAFRYRVEDENGFITPRGSHIRRANPRDTLGHDVQSGVLSSKLHRLLRRGRPYRSVGDAGKPTAGLFFIACNTDLERQFEFVHQRWLMNPRFADLENEDDPVVGAPSLKKTFSLPGLPAGETVSFQSFTTTLGGGYFFLPGLKALRFIATHSPPSPVRANLTS